MAQQASAAATLGLYVVRSSRALGGADVNNALIS